MVKQMLFKAKAENMDDLVNNTVGVVSAQILEIFYFHYFIQKSKYLGLNKKKPWV